MPIDFSRFLTPYAPEFHSTGNSSSYDQMLANRGAKQRNDAQIAAQLEQARLEDEARMAREVFKAEADRDAASAKTKADSEAALEAKRRDFFERYAKNARSGNPEDLKAMRAEAQALGMDLDYVKEEARVSPVPDIGRLESPGSLSVPEAPDASVGAGMELRDPTAGLGSIDTSMPSRELVNIRKGDETIGSADVGETRAANRQKIMEVAEARDLFVRPEDQDAEWQQTAGLAAIGAPVDAKTYEDAAGRANRESREREAKANRAAANANARAARQQRAGEHADTIALQRERLENQQDKEEQQARARDAKRALQARRDAETVGKDEGVPARRQAMEDLNQAIALIDSGNPKSQVTAIRKLGISLNKGGFTQADADAVDSAMGIYQKYKYKIERSGYNSLGADEKAEFDQMMADLALSLEASHTQAYKNMLERMPIGDPIASQEYINYLKAKFRGLPAYEKSANRALEGGDEPEPEPAPADDFEAQLREKYGEP